MRSAPATDDDLPNQIASWVIAALSALFSIVVLSLVGVWGGLIRSLGIDPDGCLGTILTWGLALATLALVWAIISFIWG